jgi:predicted metal-dependent peptidase
VKDDQISDAILQKAREIFSTGRLIAMRKAPYFRALLLSFVPRETPGLGTIAVAKNGIMIWDPLFIVQQSPEKMAGLWIHECGHRLTKTAERAAGRDPKFFNMAADLAINPMVREMGLQLPDGEHEGLWPDQFGFPTGLTTDEYYDLLLKEQQARGGQTPQPKQAQGKGKGKQNQPGPGKGEKNKGDGEGGGEDADHDHDGEGDKPQAGGGWCGSCAGRPVPGEPEADDPDGRGEGEMERLNKEVAEAIKSEAQKGIGKLPGSLRRWADEMLKPAKIPWRKKLANITRRAVAWRPGAVDHRYDAPSRRQAALGYGVGKAVLPRLRSPVPRVAVVVDTSGSMGSKEVEASLNEVDGILKAVGAEVEFCACDAEVHSLQPVADIKQALRLLKGGGGTDFRPAFSALEKTKPRPEVVVFATDGYGPAPRFAPMGMKVIWLLVGGNQKAPAEWGDSVVVDD